MQSGKNKLIYISAFILLLILVFKVIDILSPVCDAACQERRYGEMTDLGIYNNYRLQFYKNLELLMLKDGESRDIKVKQLFGDDIKQVIVIDRLTLDYSKKCDELHLNAILKNKDYCQVLIIEYKNKDYGYLIGSCEYDLMGFTKSYDKIGFYLKEKAQYLLPEDTLTIEHSTTAREKYSIELKETKKVELNCQ